MDNVDRNLKQKPVRIRLQHATTIQGLAGRLPPEE
jgi:hypothetical protein